MSSYWPYLVPGLVSGAIYSLLAVGVVLTFQTTGVLNLAFGAQAFAAAVIYYDLRVDAGWSAIPALVTAAFVAAPLIGYLLDRMVFRHLRSSPPVVRLAVSIGMLIALPAAVQILTGGNKARYSPPPVVFSTQHYYQWGSLNVDSDQVAAVATSAAILVVLGAFMRFSDVGLRMRAVVESGRLAELHGTSAAWINSLAWLISSALAGLAGVMLAPLFPTLAPFNYTLLLMAALAGAVFGRLRSLPLTVVGALLTGVGQNLVIKWFDLSGSIAAGLRPSFPFLFLFALLLLTRSLSGRRTSDPMAGVEPPTVVAQGAKATLPGTRWQQLAAAGVAAIAAYLFLNQYWSGVFTEAALMAVVFLSLMLLTGQGGFISLAHAAFVGTGAFVAAQLAIEHDVPILYASVIGGVLAGFGGLILAIPALRLGELPLALATFGFGLLCENLIFNQTWSFGSQTGLFPPRPVLGPFDMSDNKSFLVFAIVILGLTIMFCRRLLAGTTGKFATAIRGSETAAASIGINAAPLKLAIFTLSAAMAGFAGGLLGSLQTIVAPSGYTSGTSMYWLVIALVVGVYTIRGAVMAGLVFVLVPEVVSHLPQNLALLQFVLFGLGVVSLAKHPEGAVEYLLATPARLRERTRLLSGDATDEERQSAIEAALAVPEREPDPPGIATGVLRSSEHERIARRARRRQLTIDAARLRAQVPAYPIKFLYIITLSFAIDAMSRSLLAINWEDMRREFGVSDVALGPLNAAYLIMAGLSVIPFGRLTDRVNRVKLLAIGFVPWTMAMVLQGLAPSFALLFMARIFMGSVEGSNGPATPSLLGDFYPVKRRNRVFGIWGVGTTLGSTIGILVGGALATSMGWRGSFFVFGALGGLMTLWILRSLEEPKRGDQDALARLEEEIEEIDRIEEREAEALRHPEHAEEILGPRASSPLPVSSSGLGDETDYSKSGVWASAKALLGRRTYLYLMIGQIVNAFFVGILGLWVFTFFRRYHELSAAGASGVVSLLSITLVIGTLHSGRMGDRQVARGTPKGRVTLAAGARVVFFGASMVAWATPQLALAIPFFLLSGYMIGITGPITEAMTLDVVPPHLRGQAGGIRSALVAGGTALGPLLLSILSELYGLRQGLLMLAPVVLVAAFVTLMARTSYERDFISSQESAIRHTALERARASELDDLIPTDESVPLAGEVQEIVVGMGATLDD